MTTRINWSDVEWVYITLPTCPTCRSPEYITTRSENAGEGCSTLKAICKRCSTPFKICRELPDNGNPYKVEL